LDLVAGLLLVLGLLPSGRAAPPPGAVSASWFQRTWLLVDNRRDPGTGRMVVRLRKLTIRGDQARLEAIDRRRGGLSQILPRRTGSATEPWFPRDMQAVELCRNLLDSGARWWKPDTETGSLRVERRDEAIVITDVARQRRQGLGIQLAIGATFTLETCSAVLRDQRPVLLVCQGRSELESLDSRNRLQRREGIFRLYALPRDEEDLPEQHVLAPPSPTPEPETPEERADRLWAEAELLYERGDLAGAYPLFREIEELQPDRKGLASRLKRCRKYVAKIERKRNRMLKIQLKELALGFQWANIAHLQMFFDLPDEEVLAGLKPLFEGRGELSARLKLLSSTGEGTSGVAHVYLLLRDPQAASAKEATILEIEDWTVPVVFRNGEWLFQELPPLP
jgi:hypothetical protein